MFSFLERSKADKMYPEPVQIPFLARLLQPFPAAVFMVFLVLKNIFQQRFLSLCWRKASGRWLLWKVFPHAQCTLCRPSLYTFGDKSKTPVGTKFYGFSFHSCSPFPVAWILWEQRFPKAAVCAALATPFPPSSSAKTTEHVKKFWQQTQELAVGCCILRWGLNALFVLWLSV